MEPQKFSGGHGQEVLLTRLRACIIFKYGHNAQIHGNCRGGGHNSSGLLHFSSMEFVLLSIVIGMVWTAELFNTVVEKIMDHFSPAVHPEISRQLSAVSYQQSAVSYR